MTFPRPPDIPFIQSIIFVMSKVGQHIGLLVFDKSVSEEHPLYMLSIPQSEAERMMSLFGLEDGSSLTFPGSCWADYSAFEESGEIPLGFEKESK